MTKSSLVASIALIVIGIHSTTAEAAAGRTQGSFGVSNTGAATYSIPIWAPPGVRGIEPHLALVYNSRQGDGYLGVGWSLAGLSSIYRCNRTVAQDGAAGPITLTASDALCLDGNRLRVVSGSVYGTEIETFSRITAVGTAGNGPASFTVEKKDGLIYSYGFTADSRVLATNTTTAASWMLNEIKDRSGNRMTVHYQQQSGAAQPDWIKWTFNDGQSLDAHYKMAFSYSTKPEKSSIVGYVAGTTVQNVAELDSISVQHDSVDVRSYIFSYEDSATTGLKRLIHVTECTSSAQSDCLLPSTFSYDQGAGGMSASGTTTGISLGGTTSGMNFDLNGDGFRDLIFTPGNSTTMHFMLGSPSGYGAEFDTGESFALFADLFGQGKVGMIACDSSQLCRYKNVNGNAFVTTTTFTPSYPELDGNHVLAGFYGYADVDGDGRPDAVTMTADQNPDATFTMRVFVHLNTSANGTISFGPASQFYEELVIGPLPLQVINLYMASTYSTDLRKWDFNGDGREDLYFTAFFADESSGLPGSWIARELISTGTSFTFATVPSQISNEAIPAFINWNNDSCADALVGSHLYVSKCDGTFSDVALPGPASAVIDWDGDGRQDIVVMSGGTPVVYLSTGQSFIGPISTPMSSTCRPQAMDFNGDGLDDIVCWNVDANGQPAGSITTYAHNRGSARPDLLTAASDGFGTKFSPTYVSITQGNYSNYSNASYPAGAPSVPPDAVYPERRFADPLFVVDQYTASDGLSDATTYSMQFWYYDARTNVQGRGFEGFYAQRTIDSRKPTPASPVGLYSYRYFKQAFPFSGGILQADQYQPNGSTRVGSSVNTFNTMSIGATVFPFVSSTVQTKYEVGGVKDGQLISTSTSTFQYDSYGNATTVATTIADNDTTGPISPYSGRAWTSTTVTHFLSESGNANWCLNLPSDVTVTNTAPTLPSGTNSIPRSVTFPDATPDYTNCRVHKKVTEPNKSQYKVTEDYHFDGFGNVDSVTVTGAGMSSRTTTTDWGARGQFPMSTRNPLGELTQFDYDFKVGQLSSLIDPNVLNTTWQYDLFGRKIREFRPDDTFTAFVYEDCANLGGCVIGSHGIRVLTGFYHHDLNGGIRDEFVYLDKFDRPVATGSRNLAGGYDRTDTRYDSLGRVAQTSMPCTWSAVSTPCSFWTTFGYDVASRQNSTSRPINAGNLSPQTSTISYQGTTIVVTDPQNKLSTKVQTVVGTTVRSQDHNGYYQNLAYDAFGSLVNVTDSLSNSLLSNDYDYGIGAFKTGMTDIDLGSWGYTVNALGEVKAYSDPNGSSFTLNYDDLSRLHDRTVAGEGTTTWNWGHSAANFNIGKLESVTQTSGPTETYTYDSHGRLSNRHIVSDFPYDYDYTYDDAATGLLDTVTYPVSTSSYRLKLKYGYQLGILNQVKDFNSSTIFWTMNSANSRGQATQETLGNGLVTVRAFDAVTGWLSSIQCGIGGGTCAQNQSYLYDLVGNLTQRQNNNLTLTENFCYDDVYRLDHSTLSGSCAGTTNLQMHYDAMGNITSRSDIAGNATWTYSPTHKHQVTQAGDSSHTYSYDANGNAITRNGMGIQWSKYNFPIVINTSGSGETASLFYDANNARWKQVYSNGGPSETTIYVGDKLEKVTINGVIDYRHYIYANGQAVAIMSRMSTNTNTTRYMLRDALGSVSKIADSSGAEVVSESYTAFGTRRNPISWSGVPTNGDIVAGNAVTREGYTGQDALGAMGLNHMNGRVQDAITGRFLSADPFISEPGNTQNYNRYSYVNNNPLSFTDPSGFDDASEMPCDYGSEADDSGGCTGIDENGSSQPKYAPDPGFYGAMETAPPLTGCAPWSTSAGCNPENRPSDFVTRLTGFQPGNVDTRFNAENTVTLTGTVPPPSKNKQVSLTYAECKRMNEEEEHGGGIETAGNVATGIDVSMESNAARLTATVAATIKPGRPPNSIRAPYPWTSGPPSVYGWRAGVTGLAERLAGVGRFLGFVGSSIDSVSSYSNFMNGRPVQGGLDAASAGAGWWMFADFAAGVAALPGLVAAKLTPASAKQMGIMICMGHDTTYMVTY